MGRTRPACAPELRQQIVDLVRAGRSPTELSREFKCSPLSIRMWVASAERKTARRKGGVMTAAERDEHLRSYVYRRPAGARKSTSR